MTHCIKCHRPLKRPSADGYGPVCRRTVAPLHEIGRDLFGFDIEAAERTARAGLSVLVSVLAARAQDEIVIAFAAVRRRLGVRT